MTTAVEAAAPVESAKADGAGANGVTANSVKAASVDAASGQMNCTATDCSAAHRTETAHSIETATPPETCKFAETGHAGTFTAATDQAPTHADADNASQHSAASAAQAAWPLLPSSAHSPSHSPSHSLSHSTVPSSSHSTVHSSVHSSLHSSLDWAVQVLQLPLAAGHDGEDQVNAATVPVIVIDHFYPDVDALRDAACEPSAEFVRDAANFYPGARRQAPAQYQQFLTKLQPLLQEVYGHTPWGGASPWQVLQAAFALTCTPPAMLRPIQMLPHFDTVSPTTLALVHYLVGPEHGGTSFYRHRSSGLCCITEQTLPAYGAALKQQAMAARLHENPRYQAGDCALFQRIGQVPAAVNRVAIYPAHLLHSGDILQADRLSPDPREGRLTVSCLLQR